MPATAASTTSYGLGAETASDEDHGLIGNGGAREADIVGVNKAGRLVTMEAPMVPPGPKAAWMSTGPETKPAISAAITAAITRLASLGRILKWPFLALTLQIL